MSVYGEAALDRECAALAAASAGRNEAINRAAFALGGLVGGAEIDRDNAERRLFRAAEACGYVKKDGPGPARATIKSGLDRGALQPRQAPRRENEAASRAPSVTKLPDADQERQRARWLWRQRQPIIEGTPPLHYQRNVRRYRGPVPSTLAFLPLNGDYPPALIAAKGLATEPRPGELAIADDAVMAVHLVKLKADGSGKAEVESNRSKITVGKGALGSPIIVAPANDSLGLAICEGIEDALSIHEATGLGAWASGGATYLPALADAVPLWADYVSILAHRDKSGRENAYKLADGLARRGIRRTVTFLDAVENAA